MKSIVMAAGAAALLLTAGVADAAPKHRGHSAGGAALATPPQPIPYTQLEAYLAASPEKRASNDWWSGTAFASTGASTNAAATTSTGASSTTATPESSAAPSTSMSSPSSGSSSMGSPDTSGAVNPPADTGSSTAPPASPPSTAPQ